ncbi:MULTISPECIES: hypothetical protein [unclassified Methylobacterium]|uniref:hypothetical protein n=1 Tax=unclassified Methylobacterium TaxID=2615210 RepID=UPI0006F9BA5F|nr:MULTISPECIES: hypothetical protein [unclassified Methylobacterium]KQP88334.1 cyclase dehydrase [Methylobacterium sp. Leaf117]KQP94946.1 cyclase dehydrase [Methylobacterium sp. Leaf113]MCK2053439.1 cyclase dehydrase [Methylobacterium sp. 37f]
MPASASRQEPSAHRARGGADAPSARLSSDRRRRPDPSTRQVARGLGWFSLALGVTEVTCGDAIARWLGMPRAGALVRAYGVREIVQGAGILGAHDPTPWIWARVAGDGLDLATVLPGLTGDPRHRANTAVALGALAGVGVVDLLCARALSDAPLAPSEPVRADYRSRSGFPRGVAAMRGAARDVRPRDFTTPESLRAWS